MSNSNSDTVTIRVKISTQKVGSECSDEIEFERATWDAMTEAEKEDACRDVAFSMMEWHWKEV